MGMIVVNGGGRTTALRGEGDQSSRRGGHPSGQTWSRRLSQIVSARVIDVSERHRGVEEVLRTTVEALTRLIQRGAPPRDLFAIVAWPLDDYAEEADEAGTFYRHLREREPWPQAGLFRWLQCASLMQSWLKARGIPALMFPTSAPPEVRDDPRRDPPHRCAYLVDSIDWRGFLWDRQRLWNADSWALARGGALRLDDDWDEAVHRRFLDDVLVPWMRRNEPRWGGVSGWRVEGVS